MAKKEKMVFNDDREVRAVIEALKQAHREVMMRLARTNVVAKSRRWLLAVLPLAALTVLLNGVKPVGRCVKP
jgi:hypothetical protein